MASELQADVGVTGKTVYFLLRGSTALIWNGTSLVVYNAANYTTYAISATEQGSSGFYTANMPAVAAGVYSAVAKVQGGGSPVEGDTSFGDGDVFWTGTAVGVVASVVSDKTGYTLSSAGIDAILDQVAGVETGMTPRQALRLILAALAGKLSGANGTLIKIRDTNDTKDRITATVDSSGDRTAITYNPN